MNILKNKSGLSLVEVIVIAGLASLVGLIVMSFFSDASKRSAHLTQNLDLTMTTAEVGHIFSNQDSCNIALQGQNIADITTDTNVIRINFPDNANPTLFETQQVALGVVVSKLKASFAALDIINNTYLMALTVEFQKPTAPEVNFRPRRFFVPVALTAPVGVTSTILGCLQGANPANIDSISCTTAGTYMYQLDANMVEHCAAP